MQHCILKTNFRPLENRISNLPGVGGGGHFDALESCGPSPEITTLLTGKLAELQLDIKQIKYV